MRDPSSILVLTARGEQARVLSELCVRCPDFGVSLTDQYPVDCGRFTLVILDGSRDACDVLETLKQRWPEWRPSIVVGVRQDDREARERQAVAETRLGGLSPREIEVVGLLCENRRVGTIARLLRISPYTVRNHLKAVFRKLGVHSQEEVVDVLRESRGAPALAASSFVGQAIQAVE